ncbi:MAG: hypothetical protein WA188_18580 [Terriglobales bacterium]
MVALVLIAIVVGSAVPAWPMFSRTSQLESQLRTSLIAFAISELLLLIFLAALCVRFLTLNYSIKFAAVGVPCCILAFALAATRAPRGADSGAVAVGSALNFVMWVFLCMVH